VSGNKTIERVAPNWPQKNLKLTKTCTVLTLKLVHVGVI